MAGVPRSRPVIDSTPPAIAMSAQPLAIWVAAIEMALRPEEHARLMVAAATLSGSFDSATAWRAMLPVCSPIWRATPTTTSSTSAASIAGLRASRASMQCATSSSARVRLKVPRCALARPVRMLSTMTT